MILNDPEMLNWIESCSEWHMPFQEERPEKEEQKIPLSTDTTEFGSLASHPAEEGFKDLCHWEASISLNETPVCGSKFRI